MLFYQYESEVLATSKKTAIFDDQTNGKCTPIRFYTISFVNVSENDIMSLYFRLYVYLEIIFAPNKIMTTEKRKNQINSLIIIVVGIKY